MTTRVRCFAVVLLLIGGASVRAEVKDAVELLPAQTLACIEVRQPARLSREVAALVKGSLLDNVPSLLARMRAQEDKNDFRYYAQREMLSISSTFLSPEAIDEGGRLRGGFIALTGFTRDNTPEVVGVLQTGTSNFPGMFMRAFLTSSRVHNVGEVEGVPLYRQKIYIYNSVKGVPGGGAPPQREERESGPVVGQLPGMILFGSSVDSLKDVIRRARGKSAQPSLANLRAYKESAALRERPGLFAYVDGAALDAKLTELNEGKDHPGARWLMVPQTLVGKQAVRKMLFSLTLNNGNLEGQLRFDLDGKSESPLFDLLPDRAAQRELLHFAPENALLAMTGGLGDGEKRWKTFVGLLDAFYKLEGRVGDNRPSIAIREKEKKLNLRIDKDVLANLNGAGFVIFKEWQHKPDQWLLLLRATDADAAAKLDKTGLPGVFSLGGDEVLQPTEEEIKGLPIKTLRDKEGVKRLPIPVHYGRRGSVLVVGPNRDRVVEALQLGARKAGLLADAKVAASLKDIDEKTSAIAVLTSPAVLDLFAELSRPRVMIKRPMPAGGGAPPPPIEPLPEKAVEPSKAEQALQKVAEPLVFTLQRHSESVVLELRPLQLRRMTPRLLDVWVEALMKPAKGGSDPFGGRIEIDVPKQKAVPKDIDKIKK